MIAMLTFHNIGRERQKLIIVRFLFHNKRFVILDEPTSAISYDYENILKKSGFTLITISNKESLIRYYNLNESNG